MSSKTKKVVSKANAVAFDDVPGLIAEHARERKEHVAVHPEQEIDPQTAMQIAVFRVMAGVEAWSISINSLLEGGGPRPRRFQFKSIAFDSHEFETDSEFPNAVVEMEGKVSYGDGAEHGLSTNLLEDETLGKFAEDTQLRHVTDAMGVLQIRTRFVNREDRAGMHAALVRSFVAEPLDLRPGRRVVVPNYYDQICRLELLDIDPTTPPDDVHTKLWNLVCRLRCTMPVVQLVRTQPDLRLRAFVEASIVDSVDG